MITDPHKVESELGEFFYLVGKAVWYIQYLEDAVCSFISCDEHEKVKGTPESAYAYLADVRKRTLGTIIRDAIKRGIVSPGLDDRLVKFAAERNWLVHRSRHENSADIVDDAKRRALIERVRAIYTESGELQTIVSDLLLSWVTQRGANEHEINKMALEIFRKKMIGQQRARV